MSEFRRKNKEAYFASFKVLYQGETESQLDFKKIHFDYEVPPSLQQLITPQCVNR